MATQADKVGANCDEFSRFGLIWIKLGVNWDELGVNQGEMGLTR